MRLALILFMTLIVRVLGRRDGCSDTLAPPFQSKNEMTPNTKPQGRLHRRTTFYLLGGYPYGWASYGMLDSDLAKVQTEYNQNVNHFQHHNHPNHPVQHVSTVQKTSTTGKANPSNRRRGAAFSKKDSSMPKKRLIEMDDILGGLE